MIPMKPERMCLLEPKRTYCLRSELVNQMLNWTLFEGSIGGRSPYSVFFSGDHDFNAKSTATARLIAYVVTCLHNRPNADRYSGLPAARDCGLIGRPMLVVASNGLRCDPSPNSICYPSSWTTAYSFATYGFAEVPLSARIACIPAETPMGQLTTSGHYRLAADAAVPPPTVIVQGSGGSERPNSDSLHRRPSCQELKLQVTPFRQDLSELNIPSRLLKSAQTDQLLTLRSLKSRNNRHDLCNERHRS
ncbi:hypothetical protein PTI98_011916 [Pleurotus ostreatus]|nr:hypothetical protein PTI98_011916 [Pleurotus ostreatus]